MDDLRMAKLTLEWDCIDCDNFLMLENKDGWCYRRKQKMTDGEDGLVKRYLACPLWNNLDKKNEKEN